MEIPILNTIGILLGLAVVVLLVFRRFKLPTIIGFLITGIIVGPSGLGMVAQSHDIEVMAELGIILLLFIIGMEFSLKSLMSIKKAVLLGGSIQVGLTILIPAIVFFLMGFKLEEAVFIGFLMALSSTAIVLKSLQDRGEISTPHGKIALAILIFQDIIVVPMMLLTPLIAGESDNIWLSLGILLLKAIGVIAIVIIGARYLVPRLFYEVAKTKSKELFLLTVVTICILTAMLTSYVGLSLALGAFMAGLVISESEYSHQAVGIVLPFREIFSSIFFISIGMLLDIVFTWNHLIPILGFTVVILFLKAVIATTAGIVLKYPPRTAFHAGILLFQVGEFAFILSIVGLQYNLLSQDIYQYFLAISILSMAATPIIIPRIDSIVIKLLNLNIARPINNLSNRITPDNIEEGEAKEDHLVIIGYGINGKNVARAARFANVPYIIIEINADTVKEERARGESIIYGDAIHDIILEHAYIHKARVVVVAISDPDATKKIIANIRAVSQTIHIIIRTRFVKDIEENISLGADEVIPEEFETSIQIFSRVLKRYFVTLDDIESLVKEIRNSNYEFLRPDHELKSIRNSVFSGFNVSAIRIENSNNSIVGKSLSDSNIRARFGVNLIALHRGNEILEDLNPSTNIQNDDIAYVVGPAEKITEFAREVCISLKN